MKPVREIRLGPQWSCLGLRSMSANQNLTKCLRWTIQAGERDAERPWSISQLLPAQLKLADPTPKLSFAPYRETNLTLTSLCVLFSCSYLFCLWKPLFCTASQSFFLSAWLEAGWVITCWIKPIKSLKFTQLNSVV